MSPAGPFASALGRHCSCFSTIKLAEKQLRHAKDLISSSDRQDVEAAMASLDSALELYPNWEEALEMKARILLYLKRFKDVVEMLHEFLPGVNLREHVLSPSASPASEDESTVKSHEASYQGRRKILLSKLRSRFCKRSEVRLGWRYMILGQACCHLGMMEDAIILLQNGKRALSAASRRYSNGMRDDNFCYESVHTSASGVETDLVNHMIANIKLLIRRRTAAEAALEAGLYAESVRHFSKIIENQKSTPTGFLADCYLHRAIAYQATGKVVDAIADCNRILALNPRCTKALSVRASLHEMVKSYSECLLDLQQLKMVYEASLRFQAADSSVELLGIGHQKMSDVNVSGGLDYINSKIAATRRKLFSKTCSPAARTILDLSEDCRREDVEKAYLLLSLKHSPDKASLFVESCLQAAGAGSGTRDVETVKEEARASAMRLSQLVHRAYTKLLSVISEEEAEEAYESQCRALHRRWQEDSVWSQICSSSGEEKENEASTQSYKESDGSDDDDGYDDESIVAKNRVSLSRLSCSLTAHQAIKVIDLGMSSYGEIRNTNSLSSTAADQDQCIMESFNEAGKCENNSLVMVMMEAFTGDLMKHSTINVDNMEAKAEKLMRAIFTSDSVEQAMDASTDQHSQMLQASDDDLAHSMSPTLMCHESPNLLQAHQHGLMKHWNLSQPLSVT